ncbi:MAG: mechanosensitive ion channel [Gammaproteobacteria bacterium]|nr:MAG: mechanosensitive ion channel [Gammaproteobacteria bacterium]
MPDSRRVRCKEFGDDVLKIEVNAYLSTTDWGVYLELAEELNIRILATVAAAGTSLVLPARVLHMDTECNR